MLYSFLDGFMSDPSATSENALEDYARSIIEPGTGEISLEIK